MSEVWRNARVAKSLRNEPMAFSPRWTPCVDLLLPRGQLLVGQIEPVAELGRPLARDAGRVVAAPDALQIGFAPRRLRRRVGDAASPPL